VVRAGELLLDDAGPERKLGNGTVVIALVLCATFAGDFVASPKVLVFVTNCPTLEKLCYQPAKQAAYQ
jgi:hypothetical protein